MPVDQGATLTERHRQAQLQLRAHVLHDFTLIWPLWTTINDDNSFAQLVAATLALVSGYFRLSAATAATYYQAFRTAEHVPGRATPTLATAIAEQQITTSLYVTGQVAARKALAAGQTPEQARQTALTRMSGAITRLVLDGGRQTLLGSVQADPQALGWARVTDGNPCYFCLMLASRGAVYKSEQTASFEAHDHCGCSAVPVYRGSKLPAASSEWRQLYDRAQAWGESTGVLQPGENTSADRLRALRLYLEAEGYDSSGG